MKMALLGRWVLVFSAAGVAFAMVIPGTNGPDNIPGTNKPDSTAASANGF